MADDLTVDNFIKAIKFMNTRDRNKLRAERLIELILQKADSLEAESEGKQIKMEDRLAELEMKYEQINNDSRSNSTDIEKVKVIIETKYDKLKTESQSNSYEIEKVKDQIVTKYEILKTESQSNSYEIEKVKGEIVMYDNLKTENQSNTNEIVKIKDMFTKFSNNPNNINDMNNDNQYDERIVEIQEQMNSMQKQIYSIEQYLRANNLEIVGLPEPVNEEECYENILLDALNSLPNIGYDITAADIDISHPIPSRRRDGKKVMVCKFVSRKTKNDIINAKKVNKFFKYKNNDVYINEHLSPEHRRIFVEASIKRKELDYKYIWTNNGTTYMRKDDGDPLILIDNFEKISDLE